MEKKLSREEEMKQFESLPQKVQEVLLSEDTADKIVRTGQAHNLTAEQTEQLGDTTVWVLYGALPLTRFYESLTTQLQVPPEKARVLADEIEHSIFFPIRPALQKLGEKQPAEEEQGPEVPRVTNADVPRYTQDTREETQQRDKEEKVRPFSSDPYREPLG